MTLAWRLAASAKDVEEAHSMTSGVAAYENRRRL
jgi:hypothetical protein